MYELLKDKVQWKFDHLERTSFHALKDALLKHSRLSFPNFEKPFVVHLDASGTAVGATLSQEDQHGELQLITCCSKKLSTAEQKSPTHERELFALVNALTKWRHYLLGSTTIAYTDNNSLTWLRSQSTLSPRQCRWLSKIEEYNLEIRYLPGKENSAADGLSRMYVLPPDSSSDVISWRDDYENDAYVQNTCFANDELILGYHWYKDRIWNGDRVVVPQKRVKEIIIQMHCSPIAGHWGTSKTEELIQRRFIIPNLRKEIKDFIRTCDTCQHTKIEKQRMHGLLTTLEIPACKWQSVSMDWMDLPSYNGKDAILVFTDRATKMVHICLTTRECTAEEAAKHFIQRVVLYHGLPTSLHSDRDPRLLSTCMLCIGN